MKKYLYDIFETCDKNGCSDLTIALAMFLADARTGKQEYGPDGLDYEALHKDYEALADQEKDLRLFMGRHHQALARAFQEHDRAVFDAAIEQCVQADIEAAEGDEEKPCGEDGCEV